MSEKVTLEQLEAAVREIAAERPDFVYTKQPARQGYDCEGSECSYVSAGISVDHQGEGCIVGQALMRIGFDKELLAEIQGGVAQDIRDFLAHPVFQERFEGLSQIENLHDPRNHRLRWLSRVQGAQDTGSSWEEAVKEADRALVGWKDE